MPLKKDGFLGLIYQLKEIFGLQFFNIFRKNLLDMNKIE